MFAALLVGIASVWSVVVVDVVAESASSGGTKISLLGRVIARTIPQTGAISLAALAASAAVGLSAALAFVRSRRMERRMAAELDARWEEISRNEAWETRHRLFEWRRDDLGTTLERLLAERDKLLHETRLLRQRTTVLREAALKQRASLERFATEVNNASQRGETIPELIVIPDVDLGDDDGVMTSSDSASNDTA